MEKEAMDKLLTLEEDELVLWSGKPVPFKIMDQYYKPVFIRNYIIAIAIVVLIFAAALIHSAGSGGINFKALALLCCVPLVIIPAGLSQYSNYRKECRYFFTNKNIIVIWESRKLKFPVSDIDKFDSVPQFEGTVSIRIGKAVGIPVRKNREYALKSLIGDRAEDQDKGCVLYNLSEKDAGMILELIDKYRVVA